MSEIIVIGSNSFSGASFVDYALRQGAYVTGISRSAEPITAFLPYKWHDNSKFNFEKLDINKDLDAIIEIIRNKQSGYVVNFAAQSMVAESWIAPADWFTTNVVSTINLHEALRKLSFLEKYVHVSTPEVYGSCSGSVAEDRAFNPSTPYAVSRAASDMSLKTFFSAYNFPVVTTRAANVYGPGQQLYRIIPRTILFILLGKKLKLHGGGISTRSFIHIEDVSEATWSTMKKGRVGESYHISTGEYISIHDLVSRICDKLGADFSACVDVVGERRGKDAAYHLDSQKIRSELNWEDKIDLEHGIDGCVKWVRDNFDALKDQNYDYVHRP